MTTAIEIGTHINAKNGSFEMVVYQIHDDGFDVRVFSKSGRQTGTKFVPVSDLKFYDIV